MRNASKVDLLMEIMFKNKRYCTCEQYVHMKKGTKKSAMICCRNELEQGHKQYNERELT